MGSNHTFGANTLEDKLVLYFQKSHLLFTDNNPRYAPTTMRGWLSMFLRYWQLTGKGNLKVLCPIIELNITAWETEYNSKSAKTFTKDDFYQLYQMLSTHSYLLLKVFCILAIHIAARNCKVVYLTWNCLETLYNDEHEKSYKLSFESKKRRGAASSHSNYCIITGQIEV